MGMGAHTAKHAAHSALVPLPYGVHEISDKKIREIV